MFDRLTFHAKQFDIIIGQDIKFWCNINMMHESCEQTCTRHTQLFSHNMVEQKSTEDALSAKGAQRRADNDSPHYFAWKSSRGGEHHWKWSWRLLFSLTTAHLLIVPRDVHMTSRFAAARSVRGQRQRRITAVASPRFWLKNKFAGNCRIFTFSIDKCLCISFSDVKKIHREYKLSIFIRKLFMKQYRFFCIYFITL